MHQPRVGPVPPAICKRAARQLVWPLTYGKVLAQQSCPFRYPTASIPTQHQMYSLHRLRTLTEPLGLRDGQWVYRKNENSDRRSKIRDLQDTGWHEKILWPLKNSSSGIQTWRQSLPRCIRYPYYTPLTETLAPTAWLLCSGTADWTYGLSLKTATQDKATLFSIQYSKTYSSPRRPDYRMHDRGLPTTHSHRRRSGVGSRGNTW